MREESAADIEAIEGVEVIVGQNCSELQYLIKARTLARGFGVVENKCHFDRPTFARRAALVHASSYACRRRKAVQEGTRVPRLHLWRPSTACAVAA